MPIENSDTAQWQRISYLTRVCTRARYCGLKEAMRNSIESDAAVGHRLPPTSISPRHFR